MANETILVVEDEVLVGEEIREGLERFGYRVPEIVCAGEDVEDAVARLNPALILMDIRIGGNMDGIEAASRVRAAADIPVIYLTAFSDQETLVRAADTEPDGYLLKPFSERELIANVTMSLARPRGSDSELKRSEPFLAALSVPGFLLDVAGRIQFANSRGLQFIGARDLEELRGVEFSSLAEPRLPDGDRRVVRLPDGGAKEAIVRIQQIESVGGIILGSLAIVDAIDSKERSFLEQSLLDANAALQARLPPPHAAGAGYAVAGFLLPSPSGSGDLYDVFPLGDDRFAFYALDVMGHGVLPSLFAFSLHDVVRFLALERKSAEPPRPIDIVNALNDRYAVEGASPLFFTLVYGDIDRSSGAFRFVRAGHPPLMHVPKNGPARALFSGGPALGAFSDLAFEEGEGVLEPGDRLIVCSDGLLEGESKDVGLGVASFLHRAEAGRGLETRVFAATVKAAALGKIGAEAALDDASMLVIERLEERP